MRPVRPCRCWPRSPRGCEPGRPKFGFRKVRDLSRVQGRALGCTKSGGLRGSAPECRQRAGPFGNPIFAGVLSIGAHDGLFARPRFTGRRRGSRLRTSAARAAAQGEQRAPPQGAPPPAAAPLLRERGAWGGMRFFLLRRSLFLFLLYFLLAVQDIPCTRIYVATRTKSRLQSQDTPRCNWRSIRTNRMRAAHFLREGERPTCWRLRAAHARVDAGPPGMGVACFCRARGREVFLWSVQLLY